MVEYQCWFCGERVEADDRDAVMIWIQNLWSWHSAVPGDDHPSQAMVAHSTCAAQRMRGSAMEFDPSLLGPAD
jgi:hypothetical protein